MQKRFIRKIPNADVTVPSPLLESEVTWLRPFRADHFYQLPADFPLRTHPQFSQVLGMDAASAATVWALRLNEGSNLDVLDMCCAPGMKLMLIEDTLQSGKVFGADVSETRLRVCRNLLLKHGYLDLKDRIFLASNPQWSTLSETTRFESFVNDQKPKKKRRKLVRDEFPEFPLLFDRVLVDAECTHDGSDRHSSKHAPGGFWDVFGKTKNAHNPLSMDALLANQRRLIIAGFNLVKPGGLLVYSTCSLQSCQNEEIVDFLYSQFPDSATPESLPFLDVPATRMNSHSCLFEPSVSGTSGQFIASIRKAGAQNSLS